MKRKKVWLMCGIPASGKSTWIKENKLNNSLVVSRDEIRKQLIGNGEYFSKENEVFLNFYKTIQSGLDDLKIENIYIDATHVSKRSRVKILNCLNFPKNTELNVVWLNTPTFTCLERNKKRTGFAYVPESALNHMEIQFEFPTEEEFNKYHFKKVNIIEVKG